MLRLISCFLSLVILGLIVVSFPSATQMASGVRDPLQAHPRDRISRLIDDQQRTVLAGNRHPLARREFDVGAARASYRMERMVMLLQPDASQQKALDDLVQAQQDPDSPHYHQWLTPESYGQLFGISDNDLAQTVNWLQTHGMSVEEVTAGRRAVIFSGTAAQVNAAFHTQIRLYRVGSELHHANASDPEIPQALAGVVGGVASLHDFQSQPLHGPVKTPSPAFTSGSAHYMAPADFATIYDVAPLYQQGIDGSGQTIAIVGRSNINLADVRSFRNYFGLPANDPQIIVNGADPGIVNGNEEVEADLDVQWAGAVAKNAAIKFVVSASSSSSDGVYLSAQYIVNHNLAPVMSVSFGLCEQALGASGNSFLNSLWQQAAAQGITVLVSSGDSGAAGCDSAAATKATAGLAVNGLCSSPYSVCVGGTQFNDGTNPSLYWAPANASGTQGSALSYIPEKVWNESATGGLWSSGGGASATYTKPVWQVGVGVPADGRRDVPDVSLTAAGHDGYIIGLHGGLGVVGGTSAAAPSFAGLMGLVVQSTNARQGNANPKFYTLAGKQASGGALVFHDTVGGSNSVPGLAGYNATAGYDLATGLGSVDANVMVTHWADALVAPGFQFSATTSSLSVPAGSNATIGLTVTATGGFASAVSLSVSGLPAGVSAGFAPANVSLGSGTFALNLTVVSSASAGSYPVSIVATGGGLIKTASLIVTVTVPPTYSLTVTPASLTIPIGQKGTVKITTTASSTLNAAVALGLSGLPAGMTSSFAPVSIAAPGSGTSTLSLSAQTVTPGSYALVLTGAGGGIRHTSTLAVNVPGFTLSTSGTAASLASNGRASFTLTTRALGGFNSAVTLSISGLPSGVTASFGAQRFNAPGSGSTTLTLSRGATGGTSPARITVTATGGGLSQTQTITLNLTARQSSRRSQAASF
jgi:pseudomonalisin